jgi:hypothetical protein
MFNLGGFDSAKVQQDKIATTFLTVTHRVKTSPGYCRYPLLYYARAVDSMLLAALSAIAAQQSNGTQAMADACNQLLDYVATHPNVGLWHHTCDMILAVHTDASYLSEAGGKSRAAGHFYLTNQSNKKAQLWSRSDTVSHHQACDVIRVQSKTLSTVLQGRQKNIQQRHWH